MVTLDRKHFATYRFAASLLCAASLFVIAACAPPGQRLLTITIEKDGVIIFEGSRGVSDQMPVEEMEAVLPDVRFELESTPEGAQPSKDTFTLENVDIRICHVNNELIRLSPESVTLSREPGGSAWSITPE